jgi:hypothetical protein
MLGQAMKAELVHTAHAWVPKPHPTFGAGAMRRRPNAVAFALIAAAASLMVWGAALFYGHEFAPTVSGHYAVSGAESFAVFAAVPGQVLASLLMWLAVRSYVRRPPRLWLIVALLCAGHLAGIAMSALFAQGMLWYAPLLWVTPSPAMAFILIGPATALGIYFRRANAPSLPSLFAAAVFTVALGMFAWSVLGHFGGVAPTAL